MTEVIFSEYILTTDAVYAAFRWDLPKKRPSVRNPAIVSVLAAVVFAI